MGQGVKTALAVLAAEHLGVAIEHVSVSNVDTDVTPYDQQTSSSRSTYSMGSAVSAAMAEIREQLLDLGASLLETDRTDLEIAHGTVRVRGAPDRALEVGEVVRRTRSGNLLGKGIYQGEGGLDPETGQGIGSVHWHQAAGAAEVEVDLETGKVDVLRYHAAVYAGRIINPVQAELQTEGSVAFGLGQALFEEMVFDGGQLQNGNLGDYMIAGMQDVPRIGLSILEHPDRTEIHGLGETSLPPVMAAVGNAVARGSLRCSVGSRPREIDRPPGFERGNDAFGDLLQILDARSRRARQAVNRKADGVEAVFVARPFERLDTVGR